MYDEVRKTDPEIAADVTDFFNSLTGYSRKQDYNKLLVAPVNLKSGILSRIRREVELTRAAGKPVVASPIQAMPTVVWLRPVNIAARVGEQRAVVWKLL